MFNCRRCETDLAHCHGTLVRHDDGLWECTADLDPVAGPGVGPCTGDAVAHDVVLNCGDQWAGCCADSLPGRGSVPARDWLTVPHDLAASA